MPDCESDCESESLSAGVCSFHYVTRQALGSREGVIKEVRLEMDLDRWEGWARERGIYK